MDARENVGVGQLDAFGEFLLEMAKEDEGFRDWLLEDIAQQKEWERENGL